MLSLTLRRIVGAAIVAGASAVASWAVRRYLEGRRSRGHREQDHEMLHTWENEGGNLAPAVAHAPQASSREALRAAIRRVEAMQRG